MTVHINRAPEMETCIKGNVAGGFYVDATEVIRDALRRIRQCFPERSGPTRWARTSSSAVTTEVPSPRCGYSTSA